MSVRSIIVVGTILWLIRGPATIGAQSGPRRASTPVGVFQIPPFHSQVEFSVPFMGLTSVKGSFEDFAGTLLYADNIDSSSITFVIQAASLHTGNSLRDKHLQS